MNIRLTEISSDYIILTKIANQMEFRFANQTVYVPCLSGQIILFKKKIANQMEFRFANQTVYVPCTFAMVLCNIN